MSRPQCKADKRYPMDYDEYWGSKKCNRGSYMKWFKRHSSKVRRRKFKDFVVKELEDIVSEYEEKKR